LKSIDLLFNRENTGAVNGDYTADMGLEHLCNILEPELCAVSRTNAKILFVTHNYTLLKKRGELKLSNNMKMKSLIAKDRSYKITEDEPRENLDTLEFFADLQHK